MKFSPPGVVGCYEQALSGNTACPARQDLLPHSRDALPLCGKRLTTRGHVRAYLAPRCEAVNAKIAAATITFLRLGWRQIALRGRGSTRCGARRAGNHFQRCTAP